MVKVIITSSDHALHTQILIDVGQSHGGSPGAQYNR